MQWLNALPIQKIMQSLLQDKIHEAVLAQETELHVHALRSRVLGIAEVTNVSLKIDKSSDCVHIYEPDV